MRVLLAPDRFAGTLTAVPAARALAEGWSRVAPDDVVTVVAMSDGAAGLLDVVSAGRGGELVPITVPGPLGEDVPATVLHVHGEGGGTAYVEADQVIGLHLIAPEQRLDAARHGSSAGLGRLLAAALATGAGRVVVGLPARAAVHDGGAGLLAALATALLGGARGDAGHGSGRGDLGPGPGEAGHGSGRGDAGPDTAPGGAHPGKTRTEAEVEALARGGLALGGLESPGLLAPVQDVLAGVDLVLAVADDLPLLGLHGAGAVLGQDDHVGPEAAQELERALGHATDVLQRAGRPPRRTPLPLATGARAAGAGHVHVDGVGHAPERKPERLSRRSGSGAGGGAGFMLQLLGGRPLAGADVVAGELGLATLVGDADLVLTGGRVLDGRALTDSVMATVSRLAMGRGLPVVVVADEVRTSRRETAQSGISATYEVVDSRRDGGSPGPAGADARELLAARAARLARTWSA